MSLSVAEYAAHRGVRLPTVYRALHEGRIQADADGRIDPSAADRAWKANTRPRWRAGERHGEGDAVVAIEEARRRRVIADAARHELEVARLRGEVIPRARAVGAAHAFAKTLQTAC